VKALRLGSRSPDARGQSLVEFALFLPILVLLLLAIGELARIYSTMIVVESAAREAADWGSDPPGKWDVLAYTTTVADMERRACSPARSLTEYAGQTDGSTCTNPAFQCELYLPDSGTWIDCLLPTAPTCYLPERLGPAAIPCKVRVSLSYVYDTIAPTELLGLPTSFTFIQTSVFNVADERSQ
jgi:hypothetical protein